MNFSSILDEIKAGKRAARSGWNGKGMWIALCPGVELPEAIADAVRFRPYLMIRCMDGSFVPWVASQTDILADDWLTV